MAALNEDPIADDALLVAAFAEQAAQQGWSSATLEVFRAEQGLDEHRFGARGVREVARALNDAADRQMLQTWRDTSAGSLHQIIMRRFRDNLPLKSSVAALARSDALHPVDTLRRTAATAGRMLTCLEQPLSGRWRLAIAYSAAVLVWIGDPSRDQARTARATRWFLFLAGHR